MTDEKEVRVLRLLSEVLEVVMDWAATPPAGRAGLASERAMERLASKLDVETNGRREGG